MVELLTALFAARTLGHMTLELDTQRVVRVALLAFGPTREDVGARAVRLGDGPSLFALEGVGECGASAVEPALYGADLEAEDLTDLGRREALDVA